MRQRFPLMLGLALVVASVSSPVASAHDAPGPCDFHQKDGETIQHLSKRHIRCAVDVFGPVPGGAERAICIADRESGLIPSAESATGEYLGLFQHAATSWPARYTAWTDPAWQLSTSALSGRTNAIVTIRMVRAAGGWSAAGWPRSGC